MGCREAIQAVPMALRVFIGAVVGLILGFMAKAQWHCDGLDAEACEALRKEPVILLGLLGKLWLQSLSLVVLPLLFSNMVVVANAMASITNSSLLGRAAIGYYLGTTAIAVTMGITTGLVIAPFVSGSVGNETLVGNETVNDPLLMGLTKEDFPRMLQADDIGDITTLEQITSILFSLVPSNIFEAFVDFNLLGCIVFAFVTGLVVDEDGVIVKLNSEINEAAFTVISYIIEFTPIGVCFLIAPNVLTIDLSDATLAIFLIIGIPMGLLLQAMVVYPVLYTVIVRKNPVPYMLGLCPAVFTAMGTSSSAATLPVTLQCVTANGIPEVVSKFVLTVGATANMDGSAIYFPIAVIWLARTINHVITPGDVVTLFFMSTLAAIGASPIPQSGLVLVKLISESIGIGVPPLFAIIVALDPFFDRGCTMVNITGDSMGAACIAALAKGKPGSERDLEDTIPMSVEVSVSQDARLRRLSFEESAEKMGLRVSQQVSKKYSLDQAPAARRRLNSGGSSEVEINKMDIRASALLEVPPVSSSA